MTDATQDTMRTKVLDALLALFPQRGTPEGDQFEATYGAGWSISTREALGGLPKGKVSSIGVYASQGERTPRFPHVEITLPVVIEVHISKEDGVQIARSVERYMGIVERVLRANSTLSGLAATIEVTGDNVDIDSPYDNQADGALYFNVKFFQQLDDPRIGR